MDVQGGREDDAEKYGRGEQRDRRQKEKSRFPSQSRECAGPPGAPGPPRPRDSPFRPLAPTPRPPRAPTRVDGGGQSARGKKRGQSRSERAQQPGKRNNLRAVLTFLV